MKRKKKLQDCLIIILAIILLLCILFLGYHFYQYRQGDSIYTEAAQLANLPDFSDIQITNETMAPMEAGKMVSIPNDAEQFQDNSESTIAETPNPYAEALRTMDFHALRQVNPDVLGWILMPGTGISYPLVQSTDNEYYLHRTWNLSESIVGSIYIDASCNPDFEDFNTLIYGHNMANGSMFGTLRQFKTTSYWNYHPTFLITTDDGVYTYRIFSAFEASVTDPVFVVNIGREDEKQALIDCAAARSVISTGITPSIDDRIVTLSTCTGRGYETRWVVVGVLEDYLPTKPEPEQK